MARSPNKDFRDAEWAPQDLKKEGNAYVGAIPRPVLGHVAHYGELQFEYNGIPFSLCTLIRRD
jgi:hypothetical protein